MAGTISKSGRGRGMITGINITPMVDVVLVLLVIMMVSATYIVSQSLKVDLPRVASQTDQVASIAAVTLTEDGKLYFNQKPVDEAGLIAKLKSSYASNHDISLIVSADKRVSHGKVVHVIDLARLNGITRFAINVAVAH